MNSTKPQYQRPPIDDPHARPYTHLRLRINTKRNKEQQFVYITDTTSPLKSRQ